MIGRGRSFVIEILSGERKAEPKFTAEEISDAHAKAGRGSAFCTGLNREHIAAVDDLAPGDKAIAGRKGYIRLPAQGAADGGFAEKLNRYDRFTRIDRIIGIGGRSRDMQYRPDRTGSYRLPIPRPGTNG